jgi:hypothetical protein
MCLHCCQFVTPPIGSVGFLCPSCRLRGDLPLSDPLNVHFRAVATGPVAPAAAAPVFNVAAAASPLFSGQTSFDTSLKSLSALDNSFVRMTNHGVAQPRFTGVGADVPISHQEALALALRAWDASKFQPASEHLIALIRAGKLRDVGFALPRVHQSPHAKDEAETGSLSLSAGGITFVGKAPVAPAIASAQQFCNALFCTIIPALIDRPQAMMDWITLGRTALAMESTWGWSAAAQYVQRQLAHSIDAGRPFADSTDTAVLLPIMLAANTRTQQHGGHAPAGARGSGNGGTKLSVCFNWNNGVPCKHGTECKFSHVCSQCSSADHRLHNCPSAAKGSVAGGRRAPASGSNSSVTTKTTHRQNTVSAAAAAAAASGAM